MLSFSSFYLGLASQREIVIASGRRGDTSSGWTGRCGPSRRAAKADAPSRYVSSFVISSEPRARLTARSR